MSLPFALPDWAPGWMPTALLVAALLFAGAFLLMPFSVFGVKGRLDAIEARLDEIQGEIRSLALRLPEPGTAWRGAEVEQAYHLPVPAASRHPADRPPIPPAPSYPAAEPPRDAGRPRVVRAPMAEPEPYAAPPAFRRADRGSSRAEPRLDWPDRG